ncbi:MAG: hypothetical protein ACK4FJ_07455 [Ferrovibrio sp.]|uniref:hypothetical protein n=1 Tax=Ferrovibrio sp. TaxID=1917215 RepID=UPI00391B972F
MTSITDTNTDSDTSPGRLVERFRVVATQKFRAVTEVYHELEVRPDLPGDDKALAQRHATARSVLSHLALLRKLLALDEEDGPGTAGIDLDIDSYRAMVAALDEAERG